MASIRYERRISAPVDVVWNVVRRPESIPEWFPGIVSCSVDGNQRIIRTSPGFGVDGVGMEIAEEIVAIDPLLHRFVYRITGLGMRNHLGSIDVIEIAPNDTLCVYSTTAEPDVLALVIAGGTSGALDEIKRQAEAEQESRHG